MRAAIFYGKGDIRIEDIPKPVPEPGQYIVEVEWCGICGSDLHEYLAGPIGVPTQEKPHPLTGGHLPVVMGHELCGRVETAPSGSDLKAGDAVMVDPHFTCENCRQCKHDQDHLCQKMGFVGASGGNYGGGLSQFVAVDANMVHRLPDTIHVDNAAVVEPLAVAHHCIKTSAANFSSPGTSVLISGGGPIGYAVALTLRAHGARKILLSEPTETRRKYAREIVDIVINPLTESVGEKCRKTTDGAGVDVVFDCAGSKRASEDAFDAIKPGGRFVNVAMWSSFVSIPYYPFFRKEVQFYSSCCYNRQDFREVMELIAQDRFSGFEKMITRRIGLEDVVQEGFEELINNKDKHIKILISPKLGRNSQDSR